MSAYTYDVFLSYNSKDRVVVERLARKFRDDERLKVWFDSWKLIPGTPWQEALEVGLKESNVVVVFIGESGFGNWENEEMRAAISTQVLEPTRNVIPVLLPGANENVLKEKIFLNRNTWVDFREGLDDKIAFRRLVSGVRKEEPGDVEIPKKKRKKPRRDAESKLEILPFVDREEIIKFILSSKSPAYHLIDAPARFGKTVLMKQLQQYFEERNWLCCYINVGDQKSPNEVFMEVAHKMKVMLSSAPSGETIARALVQQRGKEFSDKGKKGVVLFIDVEKSWESAINILRSIVNEFIPQMADVFDDESFLRDIHSSFRVVIASRYVTGKIPLSPRIPLTKNKLFPFDYEVVCDAVAQYLRINDSSRIDCIAAHLMHYTAGHPGCISRILSMYKQENPSNPDTFFREAEERIWEDIVYPEIDKMRLGIDDELRRVFDKLSVFRFLDIGILRDQLTATPFLSFQDEFALEDQLRTNYLLDPWAEGHFLRDGITRKMLALRLLSEKGTSSFAHDCKRAKEICIARLKNPATQMPDKWFVEYLYQCLQQDMGEIGNEHTRLEISERFFNEDILKGFEYFRLARNPREYYMPLETTLNDWEFRFTVNYFLRGASYIDNATSPYERMKQQILNLCRSNN